jgi:signal peptidase I
MPPQRARRGFTFSGRANLPMNEPNHRRIEVLDAAVEALGGAGLSGVVPVTGSSMRPTMRDGDRLVGDFQPGTLRHGDILLFRQDGQLVVHRLVGRRSRSGEVGLVTRGDGRLMPDPLVLRDRVLGIVTAAERGGIWRDFRSRGPRAYGWLLAWHARFWTGVGVVAGKIQDGMARTGLRLPLRSLVWLVDQRLLRIVDAAMFRWVHPRMDPPDENGAARPQP